MLIGRTESLYLQHQGRLPRGSPELMIKNPGRGYTLRSPADGIAMAPEEAAKPWSN